MQRCGLFAPIDPASGNHRITEHRGSRDSVVIDSVVEVALDDMGGTVGPEGTAVHICWVTVHEEPVCSGAGGASSAPYDADWARDQHDPQTKRPSGQRVPSKPPSSPQPSLQVAVEAQVTAQLPAHLISQLEVSLQAMLLPPPRFNLQSAEFEHVPVDPAPALSSHFVDALQLI
jgi:hypothetical protein